MKITKVFIHVDIALETKQFFSFNRLIHLIVMCFKYLGTHLKRIAVPEMDKDQVKSGWTMLTVVVLNQELRSVDITAGDHTIVVIMRIYPSTAYRPMVCKLCY